ncbi:MAG: YihY family inner membrane protein [Gammaproteobacteria bacterium]|nr:YihY family inner membrane protein [Rhodocyclaceae bacterium]MBU3910451.1 YihY family inner membrane protein [Gammaproteobacteria bacterium]MBU3987823.1 YihY family inner membrane protein [Gammaproteobacteria bacterium]MBU4004932.1 YihY family inner membrane protein [Gammaproteobacteria bacterium]MBU4020525.1 YihY family inner membrane protein [Gammaproteobacteria bacterium]
MHWLTAPFRLVGNVTRRFGSERCAQTAAALSFATLLGLVPMLIVAAVLIEHLPLAFNLGSSLENFILGTLLPEKAGVVIAKFFGQFALRGDRVTLIGLGVLAATALMQMLTIEHAFNSIWKVKKQRPWFRRLALHLLTLLAGPLVFGGALASTTYLASASFGLVNESRWAQVVFAQTMPLIFLAGLFGLLYWILPNRPVSRWHAGLSGVLAALAFVGMQRLFALYVVSFPSYTLIYGAFAAVPIFLLWLYLSWSVILVGALLTAELPKVSPR